MVFYTNSSFLRLYPVNVFNNLADYDYTYRTGTKIRIQELEREMGYCRGIRVRKDNEENLFVMLLLCTQNNIIGIKITMSKILIYDFFI